MGLNFPVNQARAIAGNYYCLVDAGLSQLLQLPAQNGGAACDFQEAFGEIFSEREHSRALTGAKDDGLHDRE
jgi:hypothetical protein